MFYKNSFNLYTENLIAGLEKYGNKKLINNSDALKTLNNTNYSHIKALALVIDDKTGKILVHQNQNKKGYSLPITTIQNKNEFETLWKPCLKNLKDNYGIVAQIGDGLGTVFSMKRTGNKKINIDPIIGNDNKSIKPVVKTENPLNEYHIFELKNHQQITKSKSVWKDFETVFVDLLKWKKYEQVEALLRSHYVSSNVTIKNALSKLNYIQINNKNPLDADYLYSSFQKHSINVFASHILKQKVGTENYILLVSKSKANFSINKNKSVWTFPQFPVKLINYPNIHDTTMHYLGDVLGFKNSILLAKVLFSSKIKEKSSFYDDNLVISNKDKNNNTFLNWDFTKIMNFFQFDFRYYTNNVLRVTFDKNSTNETGPFTEEKNYMTNDLLLLNHHDSIFVENYYFDSSVFVKTNKKHLLNPINKNGLNYNWVSLKDASDHFKDTGNKLEEILLRNYMSRTYSKKRRDKIFSQQEQKQ